MPEPISPTNLTTAAEIIGASLTKNLLQEIFSDLHPAFIDDNRNLADIFTPHSAAEFLTGLSSFEQLLNETDSYAAIVGKMQLQIEEAEAIRDDLLAQVFEQLRPIERSYRELMLFFENSAAPDGKLRNPVGLYIFDADPRSIKDISSPSLAAIENFVRKRNDNFNFRDDVCNLVVPVFSPQPVRERLEDIANTWGMLLIGDLDDEKSFKNVERNFLPGGKYEFMKRPEDRASAAVVTMGYLELRPAHWFEKDVDNGDGLYGPPSVAFAGALVRADRQGILEGPVGSRFGQVSGAEKCRIEPLIGEFEHLSLERYLLPIIRDADNRLCFFGCRTQADDPYGVLKFFTSYRILRHVERCCRHCLLQVGGQPLTRDFMDEQIEKPLQRLLKEQVLEGTIEGYELVVDKDSNKRMQGICDISLSIMPAGPAETFLLKIDVPEFKPSIAKEADQR